MGTSSVTGRALGASAPRITLVRASVFLERVAPTVRGHAASGWLPARGAPVPRNVTKLWGGLPLQKPGVRAQGRTRPRATISPRPDLQSLPSVGEADRGHF